jgi:hypothetical protein
MLAMQMQLAMERRDFVEALSAVTARRAGIEGGMKRLKGAEGRAKMEAELARLRRCEERLREAVEAMS